ncbi:MAG: ABC transporter permease subunit [Victivallales bacterium]|nr:ABC transporter permease subunit [Victivallales bacterium]
MKSRRLFTLLPFAALLLLWQLCAVLNGGRLIPEPADTISALLRLAAESATWLDILRTLSRGFLGLVLALIAAEVLGIWCGRRPLVMGMLSPVVTFFQGCPPIVWISLLLVWVSLGSTVPVAVVAISTFPALFLTIARSTASLDHKYFQVASIYRVPRLTVLTRLIIPGIADATSAAMSYALGLAWKVTATAEYLGAEDGIGGRIYQAYRNLQLPELYAWTLIIALIGLSVEKFTIRRQAQQRAGGPRNV